MEFRSLASGSSGNCIYIGQGDTHILIDAGISAKRVEEALRDMDLSPADIDALFITHEHSDHVAGVRVLLSKYGVPLYATRETMAAICRDCRQGDVRTDTFVQIFPNKKVEIKDLTVEPFSISHDAADPVSYCVYGEDVKVSLATDLGTYDDYTLDKIKDSDLLYIEANHDRNMLLVGRYPYYLKRRIDGEKGHLSNDDTARLLCSMPGRLPETIVLAHLSKENNYPELARETVRMELERFAGPDRVPNITVALRDCPSEMLNVKGSRCLQ
ncbi:MAG: MBL fold metallo-hydrolase [Lachnospiraceae bacterium]|nr:MBL fold metallo-hydrolase [Lachnospiraceae bacterium]